MAEPLAVQVNIKAKDLLSATVAKATASLGRLGPALDRLKGLGAGVKGRLSALKSVASGAIGIIGSGLKLIGLGGLGASFGLNQFIESSAHLVKFSRRVEISVEAIQELGYVAKKLGVDSEGFEKMIDIMSKNIGMMKARTGPLFKFLERVSPALRQQLLGAKGNEEAFNILVNALEKLKDPTKRAALAAAAFGRSGVKMGAAGKLGAEGVAKLREEAKKYGIVSQEQGEKAAEAARAISHVKQAVSAVAALILSVFVPILVPMINRMAEWIAANRELIATKVKTFVDDVVNAIKGIDWKKVGDDIKNIVSSVRDAIDAFGGWKTALVVVGTLYLGLLVPALQVSFWLLAKGIPKIIEYGRWLFFLAQYYGITGAAAKAFSVSLKWIGSAFTFLGGAIAKAGAFMLANPIVLLIMGIVAAIGVAVYLIYKNWGPITEFFSDLWDGVVEIFNKVGAYISAALEPVKTFLAIWIESIQEGFSAFIDFISGIFMGNLDLALDGVERIFSALWDSISGYWDLIKAPFKAISEWLGMSGEKTPTIISKIKTQNEIIQKQAGSTTGSQPGQPTAAPGYGPAIPSAMPRAISPMGAQNTFSGALEINVKSDGPGVTTGPIKSDNRNVGITANVGRRNFALGGA